MDPPPCTGRVTKLIIRCQDHHHTQPPNPLPYQFPSLLLTSPPLHLPKERKVKKPNVTCTRTTTHRPPPTLQFVQIMTHAASTCTSSRFPPHIVSLPSPRFTSERPRSPPYRKTLNNNLPLNGYQDHRYCQRQNLPYQFPSLLTSLHLLHHPKDINLTLHAQEQHTNCHRLFYLHKL